MSAIGFSLLICRSKTRISIFSYPMGEAKIVLRDTDV